MKLQKYLKAESIVIGLEAADKWESIDKLLDVLAAQGLIGDVATARDALIEREKKMSTGMEFGLALPHAKSEGANELAIALGISKKGIDFDSLDGELAHVVFLVVSRKDITGPHIQCLAEIARLYNDESFRDRLPHAASVAEVLALLNRS